MRLQEQLWQADCRPLMDSTGEVLPPMNIRLDPWLGMVTWVTCTPLSAGEHHSPMSNVEMIAAVSRQ